MLETELKSKFLNYACDVVVNRALINQKDSLKPVNRALLLSAIDNNLMRIDKLKSSAIIGKVLSDYHAHGDASVYGALVKMVQDHYLRYPLFLGKGGWGGRSDEPPAAHRYTEAGLSPLGKYALKFINAEGKIPIVERHLSFNEITMIPNYIPTTLPLLLMNGTKGIAVGFSADYPSHNLSDICDMFIYTIDCLLEGKQIDITQMIKTLKGPDFPTGCNIINATYDNLFKLYTTGKGSLTQRAKYTIEDNGEIVIYEAPYLCNIQRTISSILNNEDVFGKLIKDVNDYSNKKVGLRIVITPKKNISPNIIMNNVFKHSDFQSNFSCNLNVINDGQVIRDLSLPAYVQSHIQECMAIFNNLSLNELETLKKRLFIIQTQIKIKQNIDSVVNILNTSDNINEDLMELGFIDKEIDILKDYRLSYISKINTKKIEDELKQIKENIKYHESIVSNKFKNLSLVKEEFKFIKEKFGDERRTSLEIESLSLKDINLVTEEECLILLNDKNEIWRTTTSNYKKQKRGGLGRNSDTILLSFNCTTKDKIIVYTNKGNYYNVFAYGIDKNKRNIINYLDQLEDDEKIITIKSIRFDDENNYTSFIATKNGKLKRFNLSNYPPRSKDIIYLEDDDEVVSVEFIKNPTDDDSICIISKDKLIKNAINTYRPISSRKSRGVNASKNNIVGCYNSPYLLLITENGKGKIIDTSKFMIKGRNISGNTITSKDSNIAFCLPLEKEDLNNDVIIYTSSKSIRINLSNVPMPKGTSAGGNRLLNLIDNDIITSAVTAIPQKEEEEIVENE